jgi:3D (Asp-Asp-Asp) domain-containing protein
MGIETVVLVLYVTAYRSVPDQTDDTPFITSIGEHVSKFGCAVSQDLLASGQVKYGDYLCIDGQKCCLVNDTMNIRNMNAADIWVATKEEERAVRPGRRHAMRVRGKR